MSSEGPERSSAPDRAGSADEPDWQRRRRLAEVFGDVLPDTTKDERDPDRPAAAAPGESVGDQWLRAQVPPHHGR